MEETTGRSGTYESRLSDSGQNQRQAGPAQQFGSVWRMLVQLSEVRKDTSRLVGPTEGRERQANVSQVDGRGLGTRVDDDEEQRCGD